MYRPKNWEEKYYAKSTKFGGQWAYLKSDYGSEAEVFEAGANAMLEGLKNKPDTNYAEFERPKDKGWLVFIPDEVKDGK